MCLPTEWGGGGRPPIERFVVVEALISEGAPWRPRGSPTARSGRRSCSSAPTSSATASCPTSSPAPPRGASA
ncbi:MAG: hypothetical protein U0Q22_18575 [Acidimicrobiales bacterium]